MVIKNISIVKNKNSEKIAGWLVPILLFFILSLFFLAYSLSKVASHMLSNFIFQDIVSTIFLVICFSFLVISISQILMKKAKARIISISAMVFLIIFSFWYNFLAYSFYYRDADKDLVLMTGFLLFLLILSIASIIIFYFLGSKRVEDTFVN